MIDIERAHTIIQDATSVLPASVKSYKLCAGKVLAEEIVTPFDIPLFDKALTDGFALRSEDTKEDENIFKIITSITLDGEAKYLIGKGECARVVSGSKIPKGADAIVRLEDVVVNNNTCTFKGNILPGHAVAKKGSDHVKGDVLLTPGIEIGPNELAMLAGLAKLNPKVISMPSVAIISTGDELTDPEAAMEDPGIRNINSILLATLCKQEACQVIDLGVSPDLDTALSANIKKGLESDVLIISGGVSLGDNSLVPRVLNENKVRSLFHRINLKPGQSLYFGVTDSCKVFALPGSPVSCYLLYQLFIRQLIQKMQGKKNTEWQFFNAVLKKQIQNKYTDSRLAVPGRFIWENGMPTVIPVILNNSADIYSMTEVNTIILLDQDVDYAARGITVSCLAI